MIINPKWIMDKAKLVIINFVGTALVAVRIPYRRNALRLCARPVFVGADSISARSGKGELHSPNPTPPTIVDSNPQWQCARKAGEACEY